ncbi:MAG: HAMP domain-containing histidine kinase [Acidimicrobiia bacterium]|nr:HAMP domain-containing histidine kinase [Acidimicrobiia bacterium]
MTLRSRLLLASLVVMVTVVASLAYVSFRQRSVLTDQLDAQLEVVADNAERSAERLPGAFIASPQPRPDEPLLTGELYVALISGGEPQVLARPVSEPDLVPDLEGVDLAQAAETREPFSADALESDTRARVMVVDVGPGNVVFAISTRAVDDAQDQLLVTAAIVLGVVLAALAAAFWSVDRLGIRPIESVTKAAEDVAAGRSDHRVEHPPVATEAGRLGLAFNTMLDARQALEVRQRRFVADASHELRTPLTTLRGYAALHASGRLSDSETDDAMQRIHSESKRMEALVEDLLTLASLDEDRPLEYSNIDLSQLLADVAADASAIEPERPIDVSAIDDGVQIAADRHQLTQALTTIVNNALRHTPTTAKLTLGCASDEATVCIQIADEGPGIAPEHLSHLFERFYRADPGRERSAGGSGLGLSIAQAIVTAHHGQIDARSSVGQGTTITIDLPRNR